MDESTQNEIIMTNPVRVEPRVGTRKRSHNIETAAVTKKTSRWTRKVRDGGKRLSGLEHTTKGLY